MSTKTDNFINAIAPLAVNEYLSRDKWILPSVCIAQAALESGWNLNATSVFGIKGDGFKATTTEYYDGHKTVIEDSFRAYPDLASSVVGYYDFLRDTPRYEKALNNNDYKDAVDKLIHTTDGAPYATAPNYIETVISIIEDFDLTRFDVREEPKTQLPSVEAIAKEVWAGKWGVNPARQNKLTEAYDAEFAQAVQDKVDELYGNKKTETVKPVVNVPVSNEIEEGDKVEVLKAEQYDGEPFDVWHKYYDVIERSGDRVVIGVGDIITCAINVKNIKKV